MLIKKYQAALIDKKLNMHVFPKRLALQVYEDGMLLVWGTRLKT